MLRLCIKNANAGGPIGFMAREHEEISIQRLHIDMAVDSLLAGIDKNWNAFGVGNFNNFSHRHHCAQGIRHGSDGDHLRPWTDELFKFIE